MPGPFTAAALAGVLLLGALAVWVWRKYNVLVRRRNQVRTSWAQVEVQLARRHQLLPELLETVRGHAAHEHDTLAAVAAARAEAAHAGAAGPAPRGEVEHHLSQQLDRLLALSEAYPALRADQHFADLQQELTATENQLAVARQFYNLAVQGLTNAIQAVPGNLVARAFRFQPPSYFQSDRDTRQPIRV